MMPNMDGWAARNEMMKVPDLKDVPVIFLSARAQKADIQKGYDAGVAEYITKPFDPMELLEIIDGVLKGTYRRPEKLSND
jgi:CheY-like chemotaxis protein